MSYLKNEYFLIELRTNNDFALESVLCKTTNVNGKESLLNVQ